MRFSPSSPAARRRRSAGGLLRRVAAVAEIAAPAAITIASPAGEYASDPNHSSVTFRLQHLGLSFYTLKFRTYDATVSFDPANIGASKVSATIKAADILAGYPSDYVANHPGTKFKTWEDDLANSTNFLDAKQFPTITFTSTSLAESGERSATVTGDLTLKGVTKPDHAGRDVRRRDGVSPVLEGSRARLLGYRDVQAFGFRARLSLGHGWR